MQQNQCMGIKADGTQCLSRCHREPHDPPHLRFCGVHWRSYTKRVERIVRFHPGDEVERHHHQAGLCLNFHSRGNAWCRNHAAPGHLQCENHHPLPVIDPQHELELYQIREPRMTYREVIDDVFRRPRLNRGDRWTIAARYYRDINPNAWEHGENDPFNEYFEWRLRGGHGLPPNEVRPGVPPQVPRGNLQLIALDRQNVHTRAVSQQTNKGLDVLLTLQKQRNRTMRSPEWFASKWLVRSYGNWQAVSRTVTDMVQWYNTNTCRTTGDQLYRHALDGLYLRISSHSSEETKNELYKRVFEECSESVGLCCDGHISRLCNVLVGFDDAFDPPVPFGEILQNKMAALFALEIPTEEKLAQAIAFFNEYAVSEEERAPWLEAF